jgi:hypothetical protein
VGIRRWLRGAPTDAEPAVAPDAGERPVSEVRRRTGPRVA